MYTFVVRTLGDFICKVAQLEGQLDTAQQKLCSDANLFFCFLFEREYEVSLKVEQDEMLCNSGFEKIYTAVEDNVFDDKNCYANLVRKRDKKKTLTNGFSPPVSLHCCSSR